MAFALRNLSVLAYANGFTLWHYKAGADTGAAVLSPGYFADAGDMLAGGDMMMVSGAEGGRLLSLAAGPAGVSAVPLC